MKKKDGFIVEMVNYAPTPLLAFIVCLMIIACYFFVSILGDFVSILGEKLGYAKLFWGSGVLAMLYALVYHLLQFIKKKIGMGE